MPNWAALWAGITGWSGWDQLALVTPSPVPTANIFGLAEYLAALALFLVILTTSDFRYRYRLSLSRTNLQRVGFWITSAVGVAILVVDVWFANGLPVPKLLSNPTDIKAALGGIFLLWVLQILRVALISPPVFNKRNSQRFFEEHYRLIHEGNEEKLIIAAEELRGSMRQIIDFASQRHKYKNKSNVPIEVASAFNFLLLIGEARFCRIVVAKAPGLALNSILEFQKNPGQGLPVFQFSRNVGREFIRDTNSSYYQEESGYHTGYLGYDQPVTRTVFGNYRFVEKCATDGASPLELDQLDSELNKTQTEGLARAGVAFLKAYLKETKGHVHSYALHRLLYSMQSAAQSLYTINGREAVFNDPAYQRFYVVAGFARQAITLIDEFAYKSHRIRKSENISDFYDSISELVFEIIMSATAIKSPTNTAWMIQHNTAWNHIFSYEPSVAGKLIQKKVSRLLYDEIKGMDTWPNFKGAHALGFCLLVFGLSPIDRHGSFRKESSAIQAAATRWAARNYARLLEENPHVAEACLMGAVTYDATNHRFVKTFTGMTGKEPHREYLDVIQPPRKRRSSSSRGTKSGP